MLPAGREPGAALFAVPDIGHVVMLRVTGPAGFIRYHELRLAGDHDGVKPIPEPELHQDPAHARLDRAFLDHEIRIVNGPMTGRPLGLETGRRLPDSASDLVALQRS
jgi:hypothetical protein